MGASNSSSSTEKKRRKFSGITGRMESIFLESDVNLGGFYNIYDHKFSHPNKPFDLPPTKINPENKTCDVFRGDDMNIDLLLKILKIDYQMALNIFIHSLDSSRRKTTKELLQFAQRTNNRTRIFLYIRPCKQTILSQAQTKENTPGDQSFTHVVTEVIFGLILLIRIEVPDSLELRDVDKQLHSFRKYLRQNQSDDGEQTRSQSLDDLKIISAWSNDTRRFSPKNISDIDKYIKEWDFDQAKPLSFCVRPIEIISHGKIGYNDIDFDTIHNILSEFICLTNRLDQVRGDFSGAKKMEQLKGLQEKFKHSLKKAVADARRRPEDQSVLESIIHQDDYRLLIEKLDEFEGRIQPTTGDPPAHGASLQKSSDESIPNILLLGETGVGKSTFINALVNYLKFDTFAEAQTNGPVVVVPAKFFITTNENFKDEVIEFGTPDPTEVHNRVGQSVTQQCKTYLISIKGNAYINIIDTPGIGDTRGSEVDEQNIQNISLAIKAAKKLTAVCILLKPNVSRTDMSFRSNLTRLLDLLDISTQKNILFCFTNTRSTSYLPGDTAPLLTKMLKTLRDDPIPYERSNIFCFDSESFRYLAAVKNQIPFEDHQKLEYRESWRRSVAESKRWLATVLSLHAALVSTQALNHRLRHEEQKNTASSKKSGMDAHPDSRPHELPPNLSHSYLQSESNADHQCPPQPYPRSGKHTFHQHPPQPHPQSGIYGRSQSMGGKNQDPDNLAF